MALVDEAVLLVDWLNLSIHLKNMRRSFGADLVTGLLSVARKVCSNREDQLELTKAHFVGENLSENVKTAIKNVLIADLHETRTAKEQADLQLAVLAMDHLHSAKGCPRLFFLATGDQDFVPLIERIVGEQAHVVLLVASTVKLAPEYRFVASQPNVTLVSLVDCLDLATLPTTTGDGVARGVLSLLRLCMEGRVLRGDPRRSIALLSTWGVLSCPGTEEEEFEGLIQQFTRTVARRVAVPGTGETGNRAVDANRTSLNFASTSVAETVVGADWILRRTSNPLRLPKFGELAGGPFSGDDDRRLAQLIDAMKSLKWLVERPDGTFEADLQYATDGLLEPLWRVVLETNRLAYEARSNGVPRDHLFRSLASTPIAQDIKRKGGAAAGDLINLAKRVGVVDTFPIGKDGYMIGVVSGHPLVVQASGFLSGLVKLLSTESPTPVPEHDVLAQMRNRDEQAVRPVFGYDTRDRQRVLRVLRRSRLLDRGAAPDYCLRLTDSAWTRSLA